MWAGISETLALCQALCKELLKLHSFPACGAGSVSSYRCGATAFLLGGMPRARPTSLPLTQRRLVNLALVHAHTHEIVGEGNEVQGWQIWGVTRETT